MNEPVVMRWRWTVWAWRRPDGRGGHARLSTVRIQGALAETVGQGGWPAGFSMGVATFQTVPSSVDAAIQAADGLMYAAKAGGKNRAVFEAYGERLCPPGERWRRAAGYGAE